jgi:hypothetical protein
MQSNTFFLDIKLKDYEKEFLEKIGFEDIGILVKSHRKLFRWFVKDIEELINYNKEKNKKGIIIWNLKEIGEVEKTKWIQDNTLAYGILENMLLRIQNPMVIRGKHIVNDAIRKIGRKKFNRSKGWKEYKDYLFEIYLKIKENNPDIIFLKDIEIGEDMIERFANIYLVEMIYQISFENIANVFISVLKGKIRDDLEEEAIKIRILKRKERKD